MQLFTFYNKKPPKTTIFSAASCLAKQRTAFAVQNPRFGIKKNSLRCSFFWWRCEICSKQSLRNSEVYELTRRRSVSPGTGVHVAEQRHGFCRAKSPHRNKKGTAFAVPFLVEMRGFEPRFVLLHPTPSTCLFGD